MGRCVKPKSEGLQQILRGKTWTRPGRVADLLRKDYAQCNPLCVIVRKTAGSIGIKLRNYAHRNSMCVIMASYELMSSKWSFCRRMVSISLGSAISRPMACVTCRARRMVLEMDWAVPLVARKTI